MENIEQKNINTIIFNTLDEMGLNKTKLGYYMAAYGIRYFIEMEDQEANISECFDYIVQFFNNSSRKQISSNISNALWLGRKNTDEYKELFLGGHNVTASMFLPTVAYFIKVTKLNCNKEKENNEPMSYVKKARVKKAVQE